MKRLDLIIKILDEKKAIDISTIDVKKLTDVTDFFVICSASSKRHAKALANYLLEATKKENLKPYGIEGEEEGEWILLDYLSVVVHIMLPEKREFYDLDALWSTTEHLRAHES